MTQGLAFTYNANDVITKITNSANATLTQTFGYDELSRLTSVTASGANQSWQYDANGNRTSHTWGGATDTYSVGTTSNRLNGITGTRPDSYTFDAAGNVKSGSGVTYAYDAFNRLKSATKASVTTGYEVNGLGMRIAKTQSGATLTRFVHDPSGQLVEEITPGSNVTSYYLRLNGKLVGMIRNGTVYFVHGDQLGRPEIVTNASKAVVWKANNTAFDRMISTDTIGGLSLGFPGQYYDSETELWWNGFRSYDAKRGRYLQSDPAGLSAGVNTYAYVMANPANAIDLLGLRKVVVAIWHGQAYPFSVGHVFVGETNGNVILSQFPLPHAAHGLNMTYSWAETLVAEGRQPDSVWQVNVPDDNAFNSSSSGLRNRPFWDAIPHEGETNCSVAAFSALQAGGVNLYGGSFLPSAVDNALQGQFLLGNPNITPLSGVPW